MRTRLSLLLSLALLFGLACSDDSTGPDKNNNGNEPAASETIGTGGGTVHADNITLSVPAGAFGTEATIGVADTDEQNFGENAVSGTYLLTGIPRDFSEPISVAIVYDGTLRNETFAVLEKPVTDPLSGEIFNIPQCIPVTVDGDSVTVVISPHVRIPLDKRVSRSSDEDLFNFYITIVTDYTTEESTSHFDMHVPEYWRNIMAELAPHMEDSYQRIEALGFDFSLPGNIFGDLDSIIVYLDDDPMDPPIYQNIIPWYDSEYLALLKVSRSYAKQTYLDALAFDATRSIAVLTAFYYTPSDRRGSLWFDISMADWLARQWHDTGVIQSIVANDPTAPLKGVPTFTIMTHDAIEEDIIHSRRLTPLIDYLDSKYNFTGSEQILAKIYQERYDGSDLAASIETVTGLKPTDWWPDFIEQYITGETGDIDPAVFLEHSAQKGNALLSESDATHTFSGTFGDLAGNIYMITLDDTYAEDITSLQFTAESSGLQDEYLTVVLFGVKNGKPYYIGQGIDTIIADPGIASEGNTFLAVVASTLLEAPYREDVPYMLTVAGSSETASFSQIVLQLPYVWRNYEWVDNDGTTRSSGGAGGIFTWTLNMEDVEVSGNVYAGTVVSSMNSDSWGHYTTTSTISVTLNDAEASASITQVTENYETDTTTTQTFEFWGMPLISPIDGFMTSYGSTIEQFQNEEHWPFFTYTYHYQANTDPEGYTRETDYYTRGANIHLR